MPEPTIVPPTPTVTQPSHPAPPNEPSQPNQPLDRSPGLDQVQAVFDRILPPSKAGADQPPPPSQPAAPVKPAEIPITKSEPSPQAPPTTEAPSSAKEPERNIPSFLEEALRVGEDKAPEKPAEPPAEEWPEELPAFKSSDEARQRYKNWRKSYDSLKEENKTLKNRAPQGEQSERMRFLEEQNREMSATLSRFGVEQSAEFQNQVMRPLYASWQEAVRIVKDSGGDPQALSRAMQMQGRAQFEALDELFQDMPESARAEAHDALRSYRRFEGARQQALSHAPQTLEALQKQELQRQYASVNQQREEMKNIFENQFRRLRDEAKLEIFQTSTDPEAEWWNKQAKEIENNSRKLYLENTDMDKMAMACILAPAVDAYRKLWLSERAARLKSDGVLKEKFGNEPSLSESPGPGGANQVNQFQDDLKKPFNEVFLREFHKSQARNR